MLDDFKKSINNILNDRITSPFWGTLISSWSIWNWKIFYVTFFVSEKLAGNKIDYVITNCSNVHNLITGPLVSTLVIITLIPFITNGAFYLSAKFDKWRIDQKNAIDMKTLLTQEQSVRIREQMANREEWFQKQLDVKDDAIKELKQIIDQIQSPKTKATSEYRLYNNEIEELELIADKLNDEYSNDEIDKAFSTILKGHGIEKEGIVTVMLKFSLLHLDKTNPTTGWGYYSFTDRGQKFKDFFYKDLYDKNKK